MKASWDTAIRLVLLLCGVHLGHTVHSYKPVVIVHGLFDGPKQFKELSRLITQAHPGTNVSVIDLYDDIASLKPLWSQVEGFRKVLYPIMQQAQNGVHLICYSQGGLVCRGLLATLPDHNVQTFISLSSPQAGQYGDTSYLRWFFPRHLKMALYHLCYSSVGQKVSICNYWNVWKENFLRIKKLVLIGGPDDGVITPWQSSHLGFYDYNENIVEMKNQDWYLRDAFGLKTLNARGDLAMCVFSGVKHTNWYSNETVFSSCIEKWLT